MHARQQPAALSIIIPAHNEESRIGPTLDDYATHFPDARIIVVSNGCTDRTDDIVQASCERYPNVRLVTIQSKVGKGGAVRAGLMLNQSPVVGFVDADSSFTAREICLLLQALPGYDAVIGSRWLPNSKALAKVLFKRRLAGFGFNLLAKALFGLPFRDTQCGAKVFRAEALRPIFDRLETANFAFDVDLLYLLKKQRAKILEAPVVWKDMVGSKVSVVRAGLQMAAALLRLRLRHSPLRFLVPVYDRLVPTNPIRFYDRLTILILNWRDVANPASGGAEVYLHEMAKRWVRQGHRVEWLAAGFRGGARRQVIEGVQVTRVGNAFTLYLLAPFVYVRRFRNRFDVLIDSENTIPFFSPLFSMKPKVCVMYQMSRGVLQQELPAVLCSALTFLEERVMPLVYRRVPFVACSEDTARDVRRSAMTASLVRVVKSGVDPRLTPGTKAAVPTILYFGRLKRFKRVDLLLRALPDVRAAIPGVRLHIAGGGDDEHRLKRMSHDLGLNDVVTFEGHVSEERKTQLLQSAWLLVVPSVMEGWGIVVIEANACGTPALAFDVAGLRESIIPNATGLLLAENDSLATSIVNVMTNESLRHRLEAGAVTHAAKFTWDKAAADMLNILQQVAADNHVALVRDLEDRNFRVTASQQTIESFYVQR